MQKEDNDLYKQIVMQPLSLHEVDSENSSFFDSDNFREVDSDENLEIEEELNMIGTS